MSKLRRALTGASATALLAGTLVVGNATPALAAPSDACPMSGSTRLLTESDGRYKVWLYQPSAGEVHVCFGATSYVRGDVVFTTGLTGTLIPTVTPTTSDPNCVDYLHLQDPVELVVQLRTSTGSNPRYVCFMVGDGNAIRITVTAPTGSVNPNVDLLLDYSTTVGRTYCQYVAPNSDPCIYPYYYDYGIPVL